MACLTAGCQNNSEKIENAKQELYDYCSKFPTSTYGTNDKEVVFLASAFLGSAFTASFFLAGAGFFNEMQSTFIFCSCPKSATNAKNLSSDTI